MRWRRRRKADALPASLGVEVAGFSHRGLVRLINEDAWVASFVETVPRVALVAVADGMGGHAGGEQASSLAIAALLEVVRHGQSDPDLEAQLAEGFTAANQRIFGLPDAARRPGTTLTAALVREGQYVIGHLGDTRAYLISAVRILQITEDHSWVAEQVRLGLLQPEEALTSPHRSRLLRVLGTQPVVEPAFYRGTLEPADTLLLCSDGLWESVGPLEVSATIQETASLEEGVRRLIDRALARSGDDNITVAAVRQGGQARPRSPALVQQARAPTPVPGSRIPPVEEP